MKSVERVALELAVQEYEGALLRSSTAQCGEYDISFTENDMKECVKENVKRFIKLARQEIKEGK